MTATTIYRHQNVHPSVHVETLKSEVREASNPSVSPTVSFGLSGSVLKNSKTITLKNGDIYEGELNDRGEFHGYGKYIYMKDKVEYQGYFQNGRQHGKGQLFKINSGSYHQGYPNHTGSRVFNKSLIYDGEWAHGQRNGDGRYVYDQDQTCYYQGSWYNDSRHGSHGSYVSPLYEYNGEWKHGKMSGKGIMVNKQTNTIFDGFFENN